MGIKTLAPLIALASLVGTTFAESKADVVHETYVGVKGGSMFISRDIPFDNDGVMLGALFG